MKRVTWDMLCLKAGTALGLSVLAGYSHDVSGLYEALVLAACAAWTIFAIHLRKEARWPSWQ